MHHKKLILLILLSQGSFLAIALLIAYFTHFDLLSLWAPKFSDIAIGIYITLALIFCVKILEYTLPHLMDEIKSSIEDAYRKLDLTLTNTSIIVISIAAGVSEEALFRGVLQPIATNYMSPAIAIILVNFIFALLHPGNIKAMAFVGILGLMFGIVFQLTGSLIGVMIGHTLYDIWALHRLKKILENPVTVADHKLTTE